MPQPDELDGISKEFVSLIDAGHEWERVMPLSHERSCVGAFPPRVQRPGALWTRRESVAARHCA
jgi:hypothetical protein